MNALEAAEAAVRHLKSAMAAAGAGTGNAWQVRGDVKEASRHLKLALDRCRMVEEPRYEIERDETGMPVRLWWPCRLREEDR